MQVRTYVLAANSKVCHGIAAEVSQLPGVLRARSSFGTCHVVVLAERTDIAETEALIQRIVEIPGVLDIESEVLCWA
jgi:nitrate reductase NapAB chaperone NapD